MKNYQEAEIKDIKFVHNGPSFDIQSIHQTEDIGDVHYAHPTRFKDFGETAPPVMDYSVDSSEQNNLKVNVKFTIVKSTSSRIYIEQFEQDNPGVAEHINTHEDQHVVMFQEAMSKTITITFEEEKYTDTINEIATQYLNNANKVAQSRAKSEEEYKIMIDNINNNLLPQILKIAKKELENEYNNEYPVNNESSEIENEAMKRTTNAYTSKNRKEPLNAIKIDDIIISK